MEKESVIKITMDHREVNEILKSTLLNEPGVILETGTLKTGDFFINDFLLIERKTFSDLVASIKDGRIFQQAFRLTAFAKHTLIIIEGTSQDIKSTAMKREAIQGALICLSLKFRIPILRSISPEESAKLMIRSYQQIAHAPAIKKQLPYRPSIPKRNYKFKRQIYILQGLPGIGPAKAKILLDRFGTLQSIFSASLSDLEKVAGIGKYTAGKIFSIVNDDIQPYARLPKGVEQTGIYPT